MAITPDLVKRYAAPVPRYTSYPTAPHFHEGVTAADYARWLGALDPGANLSLYAHIPYCDRLCWFCGCHSKMVKRYQPVTDYLAALMAEIDMVASLLPTERRVSHVHWGGGSPSILAPDDIRRLAGAVAEAFGVDDETEFAVELDPNDLDEARIAAFAAAGVTRVSFGVQDFHPEVQEAINRVQTWAETRDAIEAFRAAGVHSVNVDLVYGLPHQTRKRLEATLEAILALDPDRIALFGYAHLPSKISRQKMIDESAMPDIVERFAQASRLANRLRQAGYVRIGLDHFAKPDDTLAIALREGRLRRNFQGYTTDTADALLGLGASAIGQLPQGYVQNVVPTGDYVRRAHETGLATGRGYALTGEDKARAFVIERLMCDMAFPAAALKARFPDQAEALLTEARHILEADMDGLMEPMGEGFRITEKGRPFVRSICACFDAHLGEAQALHSVGV